MQVNKELKMVTYQNYTKMHSQKNKVLHNIVIIFKMLNTDVTVRRNFTACKFRGITVIYFIFITTNITYFISF
jgi:hypothetical protein